MSGPLLVIKRKGVYCYLTNLFSIRFTAKAPSCTHDPSKIRPIYKYINIDIYNI